MELFQNAYGIDLEAIVCERQDDAFQRLTRWQDPNPDRKHREESGATDLPSISLRESLLRQVVTLEVFRKRFGR
jgi:hypothetical protein